MNKKNLNSNCLRCNNFCKQSKSKKILFCPEYKYRKIGEVMDKKLDKELAIRFTVPVSAETIPFLESAKENGVFVNDSGYGEEEYEIGEVVSVSYRMIGDFSNFLPILNLFNNYSILDDKPQFILTDTE